MAESVLKYSPEEVTDMNVVLGIDAAWTEKQPSGVALVRSDGTSWRCVAAAPSYEAFLSLASGEAVNWEQPRLVGTIPDVRRLLDASRRLAGSSVDLITIDMPISTIRITGRRKADDAVSREFGGRGCSTHSPSCFRPGAIGETLSRELFDAEYPIATTETAVHKGPQLLEVYPHPALLSLLKKDDRFCYKVSRSRRYWPALTLAERIEKLCENFHQIHMVLSEFFTGLNLPLPGPADIETLSTLKRFEDVLDALICAWVGVQFLDGKTVPMGDETSAIWCPRDVVRNSTPTAA